MCGIAGFNWADEQLIKDMGKLIAHRGPDQKGTFVDENISLAHQRLSIIDLSEKGKQPMCNEDGTIWIVFNGEIYNFKEIKSKLSNHTFSSNTDTEVIIHAYEEWGTSCLQMFNGPFAFSIYDSNKKKLFLARDRIGINPLYYSTKNNKFIFASEMKAIVNHPSISKKLNAQAFSNYLTLRFVPEANTIVDDVKRLPAGHFILYDLKTNKAKVEEYWTIKPKVVDISSIDAAAKFEVLFQDSVQKRLMSDVPLGVYLSGGIDSSSIVAMMSKVLRQADKIKTFSVGFGYDEETSELKYAKLVSQHFATDHTEFIINPEKVKDFQKIIWHMDEPISDPAIIPVYFLSKNAKKKVTVVLTGDGGDELLAGYEQHKFLMLHDKLKRLGFLKQHLIPLGIKTTPYPILNLIFKYSKSLGSKGKERAISMLKSKSELDAYMNIVSIFTEKEKNMLLKDGILGSIAPTRSIYEQYFNNKNDTLTNTLLAEMKTVLPEGFLMKANKMTAAHAVESRVPFLDHRLVEFSFNLPNNLKLRGWKEKYLLKQVMKNYLPREIVQRKKQRFYVPIDRWIKNELRPVFENVFSSENLAGHPYFKHEHIHKLLENYNKSPLFYGRQLWSIFSFEIWRKAFLEKEKVEI